jgi:hypothetical protein
MIELSTDILRKNILGSAGAGIYGGVKKTLSANVKL